MVKDIGWMEPIKTNKLNHKKTKINHTRLRGGKKNTQRWAEK